MRYKLLGKSGLRVSELSLGTMTFGEDWGWGASKEDCKKVFDAYAEAGGNFIDTANRYTEGTAETFVGDFIAADRDHFVVSTKFTLFDRRGDPNFSGNHRKNMMRSLEASLKRLNTDYVDVFWLHAWDSTTPIEEIMRGLDDLVRQGRVLYVGISDTPAWVASRANMLAELRGWTPFVALQINYNLLQRGAERDLLPMARALDLGVTPWGILGGGVLTGKYNQDVHAGDTRLGGNRQLSEKELAVTTVLIEIANDLQVAPSQVALNWVRQQPGVIIPVIGTRKVSQLKDNLACLDFELNIDQMHRLNEVSAIDLGFPHDFLQGDEVRHLMSGGTFDQIDNHHPH